MNPKEDPATGVQMLLALRKETDALQVISEYLKVKEMGPSDHIRTKHEVKAFVESGDAGNAEQLLKRTQERLIVQQTTALKIAESRGQRI